jgi:membrane-associated protein
MISSLLVTSHIVHTCQLSDHGSFMQNRSGDPFRVGGVFTLAPLAVAAPVALGPSWLDPTTLLDTVGPWALWVSAAVIFAECGLLLGFFLPGDSLLFTVGLLSKQGSITQPLWLSCLVLTAAAFIGNVAGYEIGRVSGPAIFRKPNSRIFKQEYVDKTIAFFDTYGGRAIILARFVPIVRTFITVTAGVGQMDRRKYLTYSGIGAVLWASGVTILGHLLGSIDFVKNHIDVMLIVVVLVSVLPVVFEVVRARRKPGKGGAHAAGRPVANPEVAAEQLEEAVADHDEGPGAVPFRR